MQKISLFHYFVNMGCLCIHACLKLRLCLKMRFITSPDKAWYAEAIIYRKKNLLFSHSTICYFLSIRQGRWQNKIDKVLRRWIGWKLSLYKWHSLWMAPWLACCFIVTLLYIERKWIHVRNLATVQDQNF